MKIYSCSNIVQTGLAAAIYTGKAERPWKFYSPEEDHAFETLAHSFGITTRDIVRPPLTHTVNIGAATRENGGDGVLRRAVLRDVDGVITSEPELMLCFESADCAIVFLLDPVRRVIGLVHSGWKGTAGRISAKAVAKMEEVFSSNPADILAYIGPCICGGCYEVGEELLEHFTPHFDDQLNKIFIPQSNGKYTLDLEKAIILTLKSAGLKNEKIACSEHCTYHTELFYSYRKKKGDYGQVISCIMLQEKEKRIIPEYLDL